MSLYAIYFLIIHLLTIHSWACSVTLNRHLYRWPFILLVPTNNHALSLVNPHMLRVHTNKSVACSNSLLVVAHSATSSANNNSVYIFISSKCDFAVRSPTSFLAILNLTHMYSLIQTLNSPAGNYGPEMDVEQSWGKSTIPDGHHSSLQGHLC